jgi:hypothetical protein
MKILRLVPMLVTVAVAAIWLPAVAQGQVSLGSGDGETLRSSSIDGTPSCTGTNGLPTESFTVSGQVLFGPYYPGTFTESGSVTLSGEPNGPVVAYEATFTIMPDPADPNPSFTRITGTKRLVSREGTGSNCVDGFIFNFGIIGPLGNATYEATIETPTGTCRDSGATQVQFTDAFPGATVGDDFLEQFFAGTCQPVPTSTDDCKNGGWSTFAGFKNEGDCMRFVRTKGRKPPTGA